MHAWCCKTSWCMHVSILCKRYGVCLMQHHGARAVAGRGARINAARAHACMHAAGPTAAMRGWGRARTMRSCQAGRGRPQTPPPSSQRYLPHCRASTHSCVTACGRAEKPGSRHNMCGSQALTSFLPMTDGRLPYTAPLHSITSAVLVPLLKSTPSELHPHPVMSRWPSLRLAEKVRKHTRTRGTGTYIQNIHSCLAS